MKHKWLKFGVIIILLLLISTFYVNIIKYNYLLNIIDENEIMNKPQISNNYPRKIIVSFNKSTYNSTVVSSFEYYGGIIKEEWNQTYDSFSGFAGTIKSEFNQTAFQNDFPNALIENDEILEVQMNYASIQSGTINSSWYLNGYKGDTNSSVAILDTGVNPNHNSFPNGYNPTNLAGTIVGWENFVDNTPISDDNGHGTFISSVISGTGTDSYNASNPSRIKLHGNYSHLELFGDITTSDNFSLKIFSFNASKVDSNILVNSTWNEDSNGIGGFWFELFYNNSLVNYSFNEAEHKYYSFNYKISQNTIGIYNLYIKYNKTLLSNPVFAFNTSISFFPENFIENFNHFTGITNASKIVVYKVLNHSGVGYMSNLISALGSVINNRVKYHIISVCLSIGTFGQDIVTVNNAIDEVIENGILVIIAAGNSGVGSQQLNRLAQNKNAIVVGAINDKDQVTSYSSMGQVDENFIKPDIVAPGGSKISNHRSIISADLENNNFTAAYGTSIATAIVSAAVNILIEAKWNNWNQWDNMNYSKWVKYIKAYLLMTASETNLEREDDPFTEYDESSQSPTLSLSPLVSGLKDIHEGYGRINIQAAIDALTKSMEINNSINDTLVSSQRNPLGTHVFARQITLNKDIQYLFNVSIEDENANFDILLFSNESNRYGEPILLESVRGMYRNLDYFYFIPKKNQTNCVIIIKAVEGESFFTLNVSRVINKFQPELKVQEILYSGGYKNCTIMSFQEYIGMESQNNYSIDSYRFYIDYFDNDTSNVPPQEIYVSILETSINYSLFQRNTLDNNYRDGVSYESNYIQFPRPGEYHYFFYASDGKFNNFYPKVGTLNITIVFPTNSIQFPHYYNFNEGFGNWTYTGTGWGLLQQKNVNDNRARIYENTWNSLSFGTFHQYPKNYTYQPIKITEDPYPNGSLVSPLLNLTKIQENIQPFARFGIRVSINSGDSIVLQINLNWTGWETLRTYTNEESEWYLEEINLTDYIGNFIQFRFIALLDEQFDPINYKGFILDYFGFDDYKNTNSPNIEFKLKNDISHTQGSKYKKLTFSCEYYDLDNNYPEFMYIEMEDTNYTMHNIYGDWNSNSNSLDDFGILFLRSLNLDDISNHSFRFHTSNGKFIYSTQWFNCNNSLFSFINPEPLHFNVYRDNKYIGYEFSNNILSDYYISGIPVPKENTAWLQGDNNWHIITRLEQQYLYGGMGLSYGGFYQGYGVNWNAQLITHPLHLNNEYNVYLEYSYEISLQNEFYESEDLDKCTVSISIDYGENWIKLKEYRYDNESLIGREKLDISKYSDEDIMVMFTLYSNDNVIGLGYGWLLNDIYIGYDKSTDFIAPDINILTPQKDEVLKSIVMIEANITDNVELDESRIYILLNNRSVDMNKLLYDSNSSKLEFKWNTNRFDDGKYELRVCAYDMQGNKGETFIMVRVNNFHWWNTWGPYIILIATVVLVGIAVFIISEKKGKVWIEKIKNTRAEKIRLSDIDKDQTIKRIELVELEEELKRPLTLYCKSCKSWFSSEKYDIICPICEHDQIYAAYICENCGKLYLKEEPKENYYCKNKNCEGVRLIRREKEDIQKILNKQSKILRDFEIKKKKFSILD